MAIHTNERTFVQCAECAHATLMQWFSNPVVAQCSQFKDRQVAHTKRICKEYAPRETPATITHYDKYDIKE